MVTSYLGAPGESRRAPLSAPQADLRPVRRSPDFHPLRASGALLRPLPFVAVPESYLSLLPEGSSFTCAAGPGAGKDELRHSSDANSALHEGRNVRGGGVGPGRRMRRLWPPADPDPRGEAQSGAGPEGRNRLDHGMSRCRREEAVPR